MYGTSGLLPFRTRLDHLHRDLLLENWGRFYSELAESWLAILIFTSFTNSINAERYQRRTKSITIHTSKNTA